MSEHYTAQFMVAVGTMAVVLLILNSVAASSAPMLRFVVAIGVAIGVVALVRRATDAEVG
jgi:hypothetical protein